MSGSITVWFNPNCSKSRGLRALLEERGIEAEYRHYLEQPPTRADLEAILAALGESDPQVIMRPKEAPWSALGLDSADREARLAALSAEPILLERPIVVHDGRAVVARPPERVEAILDD